MQDLFDGFIFQMLSDIKTLKDIARRTMYGSGRDPSKKQKSSVSAQFQWSLNRLMSTLQQANPFFIRCIKSNADKVRNWQEI